MIACRRVANALLSEEVLFLTGRVWICAGLLSLASCTTETIRPGTRMDASVKDSSNATPLQCPADVPDACPSPVPSWATQVVPILDAKCNGCHTGGDAPWPLTNYPDVLHWRAQVLYEIERCTMPPPDDPKQLTASERTTLIDWLVCGAPEN